MSEYQYYEFLAVDRPLTADQMEELRALSTRATITPVSFTNEYNWGDFKGDPGKLMRRYFDAHVYVANWMTAIFMARLAPVRDELLRGDLRSLYIGWLAAVAGEMVDDDETEPLCVSGLGDLTAAQQALAEFLEVDPDLLAGAGMDSPAAQETQVSRREMENWIDALPREEVHSILKLLLEGKGQQAERSIRNRFASWRRGLQTGDTDAPRRTVGELRQNAEKARLIRMEKQKRDRRQREIRRREKRNAYLKDVASDFPKAWASVKEPVERGSGRGYNEACRILVDIAEAHDLFATKKQFQNELENFMAGHLRRKALIQPLVKAGVWKDQ